MSATGSMLARATARLAAGLLAVVVASCAMALAAPMGASAATQAVQFSSDGIHWSGSYAGQLFDGVLLVPNNSASRSFYVRNAASEAGLLTVTLFDVTTDDPALASAMTISSSISGFPGATTPVTLAQPCRTLSDGLRLSTGDSARIDNTVELGDLSGAAGQNHSVGFRLLVSLRSTDAGAPLPNTCPVNAGTVPVFSDPSHSHTSGSKGGVTTATVYRPTVNGWVPSSTSGGAVTATPTTPSGATDAPSTQALVSNTSRLYQEYDVAFWLAMSVLGALVVVVARRRRADNQPSESTQGRQIGTDR